MQYRQLFDEINDDLTILSFILPASSPHSIKTTTLTGMIFFMPVLCPDQLAALLDLYQLLIRPVKYIFTEILLGVESRSFYKEYIWVQNSIYIISIKFSQLLASTAGYYINYKLSLQPWRHIVISIMWEFVPSRFDSNHLSDLLSNLLYTLSLEDI